MSAVDRSPARPPLRRIELPAVTGVLVREVINFGTYWKSSVFSSTVDPTIYLLAFGFGIGSLVSSINGLSYVDYIGTGVVATAVLFSSAFPAMFGTFIKYQFQRTYDAILAAPVDTEELVTAEILWIAARAGVFGCSPMVVAMFFGLDPSWGMLLVPFIAFIAGFGWAGFGVCVAARMKAIDSFSYVISGVLTPLFLLAGTFFPLDQLPHWAYLLAQLNPLYHCVQLVRDAVFGLGWDDLFHLAFLLGYGFLTWRLGIAFLTRRLVT